MIYIKNHIERYDINEFDIELVNEVKLIMGERWGEMVDSYIKDTAAHIKKVKYGFDRNDKRIIYNSAHSIKSLSHIMGIIGLYKISKMIEEKCRYAIKYGEDVSHLQEFSSVMGDALMLAKPKLRATI